MLSVSLISIECVIFSMLIYPVRKRVFNREFMVGHFYEEHKKVTDEDIGKTLGYPDTGSGIYSKKLKYNDWLEFNKV